MTVKIEEETLCEYCKAYHGNSMNNCEGKQCERMEELYLDEHGITIEGENIKSFSKACVGDKFYHLNNDEQLPHITIGTIGTIELKEDGNIQLQFKSVNYSIIPKDDVSKAAYDDFYLNQKECERALEELCIKRIVELSKIIGSVNLTLTKKE